MPTDPLTGSRFPAASAAPNVPQDIQNAVMDLADNTIPRFATTTARDTAYANYVAAGGVMADGMECTVGTGTATMVYLRRSGAWSRQSDIPKPRVRMFSTSGTVSGAGVLYGIGPTTGTGAVSMTTANGMDVFVTQRQDGLNVQPGIYVVTFNIKINSGGTTTARSLLDIVGNTNTEVLSRSPMTWPGEANGTNSTTLFLPIAQQVRFLVYLTTDGDPLNVTFNVDMMRLGDF